MMILWLCDMLCILSVACWLVCLWFALLCVGHVCGDACGIVGLCLVCFYVHSCLCVVCLLCLVYVCP